jgi:hypothetical protein
MTAAINRPKLFSAACIHLGASATVTSDGVVVLTAHAPAAVGRKPTRGPEHECA